MQQLEHAGAGDLKNEKILYVAAITATAIIRYAIKSKNENGILAPKYRVY